MTPASKEEIYLAKLCGEDWKLPYPTSRLEYYYAKLCGMDVPLPAEPFSRSELYLAYLCGTDVKLPEPVSRKEMYMAKACGMDVDYLPETLSKSEIYWQNLITRKGITGELPLTLIAHTPNLLDYQIYGGSISSPTETPDEIQGVGTRTVNIMPEITAENGWVDGYLLNDSGYIALDTFNAYQERTSPFIKIDKSASYAFSSAFIDETQISPWYGWLLYDNDKRPIGSRHSNHGQSGGVIHATDNAEYIRISLRTYGEQLEHVQLQLGTQATSYEPYGYQLPVSCRTLTQAGTTTSLFIGSEPLKKDEYISYREQKRYHVDGTATPLTLPQIPIFDPVTVIDVKTPIKPSQIRIALV